MNIIRFLSMVLISLDLKEGTIEYSNAGHNPPLFWNNAKQQIELLNHTSPAMHSALYLLFATPSKRKGIQILLKQIKFCFFTIVAYFTLQVIFEFNNIGNAVMYDGSVSKTIR